MKRNRFTSGLLERGLAYAIEAKAGFLNIFQQYSSDFGRPVGNEHFCKAKIMFHHPVRCTDLSDFFTLHDGTPIIDRSSLNEHCHAHHGNLNVRMIRWSPFE